MSLDELRFFAVRQARSGLFVEMSSVTAGEARKVG
jgi:hypothetical protein